MIPLTKLPPGKTGRLARIGGDPALQSRLARLGLTIDRPIRRYADAPLGGGSVWQQGSLLVALREEDAANLLAEEEAAPLRPVDCPAPLSAVPCQVQMQEEHHD